MNWEHLIYFHKVAETENFTAAANELFITTSALSKSIKRLETELGFPLFEKSGRNSILTPYGKIFDTYVTKAMSEIETGIQIIRNQMNLIKGQIKIAGVWTMIGGFLPEIISKFNDIYPDVTYITKFMLTNQILNSVLSEEYELGFCGDFNISNDRYNKLDRHLLYQENLVIIVPTNHPLADESYLDFDSFSTENFITYKNVNSGGVFEAYIELCEKYAINPRITFEAQDDHTIVALVKAGMGIAIIPESKWLPLEGVSIIRFENDTPKRKQYVIWKKNSYLSPVAKAFLDFVIKSVK